MATIDNLVIEVSANTRDAEDKIRHLSSALNSLKNINAQKLNGVADGFLSVKRAVTGIRTDTIDRIERLATALERVANANVGGKLKGLGREISKANKVMYVGQKTPQIGKPIDSATKNIASRNVEKIAEQTAKVGEKADKSAKSVNNLKNALQGLSGKLAMSSLKTMWKPFELLGGALRRLTAPLTGFIRSIGRIALYRAIRSAIKMVTAGIKEGIENLAMFSYMMGEMDTHKANRVMSLYTSNFLYLKNAIATAVIPVLKMLEPIIDTVINKAVDLINVLAQLFSFLSGSDTYTKAKYYYQDFAENLDKASGSASKLNKQLAKFDEINNLTTNEGRGSGKDIPNYLEMFEDPVPIEDWIKHLEDMDFFALGRGIANKIQSALESIDWGKIYTKSMKLGKNLGEFLNGLIKPETFRAFGKTIAGGVMTAIKFAFSFGKEFDWENLGVSIAEAINGFFDEFDGGELADTVDVWVQGLSKTLKKAVETIKWAEIFNDLLDFFKNLDVDTMNVVVSVLTFTFGAGVVVNALKWAFSSALSGSVISLPAIAVALAGGVIIGNGVGQVVSYLQGNEEDYQTYEKLNPFTNEDTTVGKVTTAYFSDLFDVLSRSNSPDMLIADFFTGGLARTWQVGYDFGEKSGLADAIVRVVQSAIKDAINFFGDDPWKQVTGKSFGDWFGDTFTTLSGWFEEHKEIFDFRNTEIEIVGITFTLKDLDESWKEFWTYLYDFWSNPEDYIDFVKIDGFIEKIRKKWEGIWFDAFDFWSDPIGESGLEDALYQLYKKAVPYVEEFKKKWGEFWTTIFDFWSDPIGKSALENELVNLYNFFNPKIETMQKKWDEFWTTVFDFWSDPLGKSGLEAELEKLYKKVKEKLDGIKEKFEKIGSNIVGGIVKGMTDQSGKISLKALFDNFVKALKKIFDIHSPSDKKEIKDIGKDIVLGVINGFDLVDFYAKMTDWWNTNVKPWFTVERWLGIANNIKTAISTKWNETKNQWQTNLTDWWTNNVAPWFTLEKWKGIADGIRSGIVAKWNEVALWLSSAFSKVVSKAKEILNYASFYNIGSTIGKGLKSAFNVYIGEMKSLWNGLKSLVAGGLSMIITVGVNDNGFNSALANWQSKVNGLIGSISQLNLGDVQPTDLGTTTDPHDKGGGTGNDNPTHVKTWHNVPTPPSPPAYVGTGAGAEAWKNNWIEEWKNNHKQNFYASGGYPIQGSLFVAGESGAELVGNINGRTGVANTDQITEAIYTASYNGMSKALAENGMNVTIEGDTNKIFRVVRKDAREFYNQNGFSPFPV